MKKYRCFHCEAVFTDVVSAAQHFGPRIYSDPACTVDAAKLRELEERLQRFLEEDSDADRALYRLRDDAQVRVLRAEEEGYERGLAVSLATVQACVDLFDFLKDKVTIGSVDTDHIRGIVDAALRAKRKRPTLPTLNEQRATLNEQRATLSIPHDGTGALDLTEANLETVCANIGEQKVRVQ